MVQYFYLAIAIAIAINLLPHVGSRCTLSRLTAKLVAGRARSILVLLMCLHMFYAAYNYTRKTNGAHRSFLFLFIAAQASFGSPHWSINITFPPLPLPPPAALDPRSSRSSS